MTACHGGLLNVYGHQHTIVSKTIAGERVFITEKKLTL